MIIFFLFVMGTIFGSFMNVCIYRLPRKESIVSPRSRCPVCGGVIRWFDNIPILSYLILKGKCRSCGGGISPRYAVVEILSGLMCALLFLRFGFTAKFFIFFYLTSALIVISFVDLKIHEIPDEITLSGIVLGLILAALYPPLMNKTGNVSSLLDSLLGVLAGGGSIYLLGYMGEFIFKREAMGGGDVKLLAMIGAFLGWKLTLFTFFLAPFFGSLVGIVQKIKEGRDIIPYGPYLSIAAVVSMFYGEAILRKIFFI
ncbi:MAG: prepilin peptidase [Candidatus Omnitrophota bacterium]